MSSWSTNQCPHWTEEGNGPTPKEDSYGYRKFYNDTIKNKSVNVYYFGLNLFAVGYSTK